jgi:hypothetical protein
MKLSKNTLGYLKHFSTISPNFIFKKGTQQNTIAGGMNRSVLATLDTNFPLDFPIRDLGGFLKAVSSFDDPDIKFTKSKLTVSGKDGKIYFKPSNRKDLILPTKTINFPKADIEFEISSAQYSLLISSLKKHYFYHAYFEGDGKFINAITEPTYRGEYVYEQTLGKTNKKFSFRFIVSNLICPIDDYKVSISSKGIAKFESKNCDYVSYVAIEKPRPK